MEENPWAEGLITDYREDAEEHCIVYNINAPDEAFEWFRIKCAPVALTLSSLLDWASLESPALLVSGSVYALWVQYPEWLTLHTVVCAVLGWKVDKPGSDV